MSDGEARLADGPFFPIADLEFTPGALCRAALWTDPGDVGDQLAYWFGADRAGRSRSAEWFRAIAARLEGPMQVEVDVGPAADR